MPHHPRSLVVGPDLMVRLFPWALTFALLVWIWTYDLPVIWQMLSSVLVIVLAVIEIRRMQHRVFQISLGEAGHLRWQDSNEVWHDGYFTGASAVTSAYLLVCWQNARGTGTFLISRRMQDAETFGIIRSWAELLQPEEQET